MTNRKPRLPTITKMEAAAREFHLVNYAARGDRYATPEEMEMHLADPLACYELVRDQLTLRFGAKLYGRKPERASDLDMEDAARREASDAKPNASEPRTPAEKGAPTTGFHVIRNDFFNSVTGETSTVSVHVRVWRTRDGWTWDYHVPGFKTSDNGPEGQGRWRSQDAALYHAIECQRVYVAVMNGKRRATYARRAAAAQPAAVTRLQS